MRKVSIDKTALIRTPDGMDRRDISAWYEGCYVVVDESRVAYCHGLGAAERSLLVSFNGHDAESVDVKQVAGYWPVCGCVNISGFRLAANITRTPRRQWRRSFVSKSVKAALPGSGTFYPRKKAVINRRQIESLFTPEYPETLNEAFDLLKKKRDSVAISPQIILLKSPTTSDTVVFSGDDMVGTLNDGVFEPFSDTPEAIHISKMFARFPL